MKRISILFVILLSAIACDDIIEVEDISDKTVQILAPTNGAILDTLTTTFTWDALEAAESYHLQVVTPSFENANQIVADTLLVKTSFSKLLPINTYEWRIRAENAAYKTSYTKQSFTIED
ncbi:hypothetical protein [Wocania ichthyoenteri]|uniref:hypothetical protein n=1 Tax=Wocania ichthyoenteri TaxID=1230531 RepID=UPI000689FABD|nr:hypothetical protein [Wocania ichthyoenteri]